MPPLRPVGSDTRPPTRGDVDHERAVAVLGAGDRLHTSEHVLIESWLLLARRLGADAADRFWGALRDGAGVVEPVAEADLAQAWAIGLAFPDQGFSIVDRTSFALMERLALTRAASLDDDFAVYRFGRRRDRAFSIVR